MKVDEKQALQGSAEPDVESQDNGIEQERAALAAESAKLKAQSEELASELEIAKAERAEAARILATSHADRNLKAFGNRIAPAILNAGAAEILVALELGQDSAEINGESVDLREAVLGLLGSSPDVAELGFGSEDMASSEESGDGPRAWSKNKALLQRHGITEERLAELQNKYPAN